MTSVITQFARLFRGREDVFARGYPSPTTPGKYNYATVNKPLSEAALRAHLDGGDQLGVYPVYNTDQVDWFAFDFDAPKEKVEVAPGVFEKRVVDGGPEVAFEQARQQMVAFERAGLVVYLERSRSGNGFHVWGFLENPRRSGPLRRLLRHYELASVDETMDRFYPMQDRVTEGSGSYGNLIALPYSGGAVEHGNGMFLKSPDFAETYTLREFLNVVEANSDAVLDELEAALPKDIREMGPTSGAMAAIPKGFGRPERPISGWLKVASKFGCNFVHECVKNRETIGEPEWYALIQQTTCFKNGEAIAHAISRDYPGYSASETSDKYQHAAANIPVGCEYIRENFPKLACSGCSTAPYRIAKKPILELVQQSEEPMRAGGFKDYREHIRRRQEGRVQQGVGYGIAGVQNLTKYRDGELTVIGAMPSIGKTALMVDQALNVARQGHAALVFSPETGETGLRDRFIANMADVDSKALRNERYKPGTNIPELLTDAEWDRIEQATAELDALPIYINYTAINADTVLKLVEDTVFGNGLTLDSKYVLFFDYLQFGAKLGAETNYERISRLSTEFKNIAKILGRPVVIYSQLVRGAEGNETPQITWFKESGRIEQDADVALILTGDRIQGTKAQRRLWCVKQREGDAGWSLDFLLHQSVSRFEWLEPVQQSAGLKAMNLLEDDPESLF